MSYGVVQEDGTVLKVASNALKNTYKGSEQEVRAAIRSGVAKPGTVVFIDDDYDDNIDVYATSVTGSDVTAKVAVVRGNFVLREGRRVVVKFDYGNTAEEPTLNVNETGDLPIKSNGDSLPSIWWKDGDVVEFTYDEDNNSWLMGTTSGQLNEVFDQINTEYEGELVSFRFGIDGNGDYGYIKEGETSVTPFKTRHTETYKPTSRAANLDMGLYHQKRYVDTTSVPNTNSGTYKPTQRKNNNDMGATNTYRYVDTTSVPNTNSQTYSVTSNGTFDMGAANANRYVSVNVPNPSYGTNLLTNTISGISIVQTYGCSWSGTTLYVSAVDCGGIVIQNDSGYGRYIIVITDREVESTYQCGLGTTQATLPSVISSGAYRDGNNYVSALHTMAIGKTVPTGKRFYFGTQLANPKRDYYILAVIVV